MDRFGLSEKEITSLHQLLNKYSSIEKVVIYGSRAKGNFSPFSDIDITLFGEKITKDELSRLLFDVDYLLLPYNMDISIFHKITNPDVVDHINRVGQLFYERK